MNKLEVTCIVKPKPHDPYTAIQKIGSVGWQHTLEEAIENIEEGKIEYFTRDEKGQEIPVKIYFHPLTAKKYLKTYPDGKPSDNLLELDQCPVEDKNKQSQKDS